MLARRAFTDLALRALLARPRKGAAAARGNRRRPPLTLPAGKGLPPAGAIHDAERLGIVAPSDGFDVDIANHSQQQVARAARSCKSFASVAFAQWHTRARACAKRRASYVCGRARDALLRRVAQPAGTSQRTSRRRRATKPSLW